MPPENLPEGAKRIYVAAEEGAKKSTCKNAGERKDECAARVAWKAVKNKYKKVGDKWVPKAELASFSMAITKTSYDKLTNTRRWKAVASDIDEDNYNDNMTLELYEDFLQRIESKEQPPESFRNEFWAGGMPYLSISHYPDLNGKGVPGPIDTVYVDGKELKSTGRFDDTPLGKACFQAISRDLDIKSSIPNDEKVRISIAFLDWKHRHKSNGFVFDRAESEDVMCPECLKELLESFSDGEKSKGKEFLRGHLVHLALTRVPVNQRTKMEVERSMATQKEDAASIIGDEQAEELDELAKEQVIGKSEALVVKSEDEEEEPLIEEEDEEEPQDELKAELVEEAKKEKEPEGEYGDVEYADTKNKKYPIDTEKHIRAAWNYINMPRNQKGYSSSEVASIKRKIVAAWKKKIDKEGPPSATKKSEADQMDEAITLLMEIKARLEPQEVPVHPLDIAFSELKAVYDEAIGLSDPQEALRMVQEPFEALAAVIQSGFTQEEPEETSESTTGSQIVEVLNAFREEMGLFKAEVAQMLQQKTEQPQPQVPVRRSVNPALFKQPVMQKSQSETPKLREIVERSVGY